VTAEESPLNVVFNLGIGRIGVGYTLVVVGEVTGIGAVI